MSSTNRFLSSLGSALATEKTLLDVDNLLRNDSVKVSINANDITGDLPIEISSLEITDVNTPNQTTPLECKLTQTTPVPISIDSQFQQGRLAVASNSIITNVFTNGNQTDALIVDSNLKSIQVDDGNGGTTDEISTNIKKIDGISTGLGDIDNNTIRFVQAKTEETRYYMKGYPPLS